MSVAPSPHGRRAPLPLVGPCGEGLGVGVGVAACVSRNNNYPPPQPSTTRQGNRMWKFWIRMVRSRAQLDSKVARASRPRLQYCAVSPKTVHMRLPCPTRGREQTEIAARSYNCTPHVASAPHVFGSLASTLPLSMMTCLMNTRGSTLSPLRYVAST